MGMVTIENGKVVASQISPIHDHRLHDFSASDGEEYDTFKLTEEHASTLSGLGTYALSGGVVTIGTGAGIGTSRYVKTNTVTLSSTVTTILRFKISSIGNGVGDNRATHIGMSNNFTTYDPETELGIVFSQDAFNNWECWCSGALAQTGIAITKTIASGTILTIAANLNNVKFYVDDTLVGTAPSNSIPTGALSVGFGVIGTAATVTSTRTLGVVVKTSSVSVSASSVTNTPAGGITATDVQAALNELDTEKLALAGGTMTGVLAMGANAITTSSTVDGVDVSAIPTTYLPLAGGTMSGNIAMGAGGTVDGIDVSAFKTSSQNVYALTPGANIAIDPTLGNVFTITPDQATAITMASQIGGQAIYLIATATATSRVITPGAGFLGSATITTGTTAGKKFIQMYVSDGVDYVYRGSGGPF